MASVSASDVREAIGDFAATSPSDEIINKHIARAARYVGWMTGSAIDYSNCTDKEADAIVYRAAYTVARNLSSKISVTGTVEIGDVRIGDRVLATRDLVAGLKELSEEHIEALGVKRAFEFTETIAYEDDD